MTLTQAVESAERALAAELLLNRDEASALIEHLKALPQEPKGPSPKQLSYIDSLVKKAGMDEVGACALVGANSYAELSSGKDGTASALIDALKERIKGA